MRRVKILLLADLHSERAWYRWVLSEVVKYDLVCIAGDLIDMFKESGKQVDFLREQWLPTFIASGKALALCSGNHDFSIAPWLSMMNFRNVVADGQTQLLTLAGGERLVVTTCPYTWSFNEFDEQMLDLWRTGARLRQQHDAPWLVLHHEPPEQFSPARVINKLGVWIERFSPDYVSSGHFHESTAVLGRFCHRVQSSWCFNNGCMAGALIPNHTVLDTAERTAVWNATTPGWRQETQTVALSQ